MFVPTQNNGKMYVFFFGNEIEITTIRGVYEPNHR
jgi:hypothetical protein